METNSIVIYGVLLVPIVICGVLLVLKFTKLITWPWIWVLSPLWIPVVLYLAFIVLMIIVPLIFTGG